MRRVRSPDRLENGGHINGPDDGPYQRRSRTRSRTRSYPIIGSHRHRQPRRSFRDAVSLNYICCRPRRCCRSAVCMSDHLRRPRRRCRIAVSLGDHLRRPRRCCRIAGQSRRPRLIPCLGGLSDHGRQVPVPRSWAETPRPQVAREVGQLGARLMTPVSRAHPAS
jgi:hypothetical protein